MSDQFWWFTARSSGIVALLTLTLSLLWGVLVKVRPALAPVRPAWVLDLHGWLGGLGLTLIGLHLFALAADDYIQFDAVDLFVPGQAAYEPLAVGLGIVAMYVLIAVQLTAASRRRLPRRMWKAIHFGSYGALWLGFLHAGLAGSDVRALPYRTVMVGTIGLTIAAIIIRIVRAGLRTADDTG